VIYLSTLLMSLFVTMALVPIFIRVAIRIRMVDVPNDRKVHTAPIPRCGGIAIAVGACLPIVVWRYSDSFIGAYLAAAGVLVITGLIDDYRGLNYRVKFACQILAAALMVIMGGIRITSLGTLLPEDMILPGWLSVPLTIFAIVAVTNAVNLSDGLDGLAGGLCLLSICCIGYLAYLVENPMVVILALSLAGAIFGFLRFNSFPASLFMGDTGSMFLGFSVVSLSLAITQDASPFSPWLPLIIVGLPVMDTAAVMIERMAAGRSPFVADKNHFHHKLLRMGLYHTESVMVIYILQGIMISAAIFFRFFGEGFLLTGYVIFFGLVLYIFFFTDRFHWRFQRTGFMDTVVKGRFRTLKERGVFIKIASKGLEIGLPLLLIATCFVPDSFPSYLPVFSAGLLVVLSTVWFFRKSWMQNTLILILYLFIPFIVFTAANTAASWIDDTLLERIYHGAYLVFIIFVITTLRLTNRRSGFKISPSDFLIIFISLLAPLIAGTWIKERVLAEMTAKTLLLFFSYEVLIGELRGNIGRLTAATGVALLVVILRGWNP
jgi:UDP-GlcNAc:undecaprenyl-phosphate GlcNAc-1-phosphate transferase